MYTCSEVTRSARTSNVHHPKGNHLFVSVNMVVLKHGKASSYCYSFLHKYHYLFSKETKALFTLAN